MPNTLYLLDSNILIRWIQPDDRDYALVKSALDLLLQQQSVLCRKTWQSSGTRVRGH